MYSHAVEADGWLYVTGQLPTDPDDPSAPLRAGIEEQALVSFENLRRILLHAGFSFDDVLFVRIYLSDYEADFSQFNAIYARQFSNLSRLPSRTTVGVTKLGRNARVEIDLVCFNRSKR
jgi:reactive intermediate/imine deaminase